MKEKKTHRMLVNATEGTRRMEGRKKEHSLVVTTDGNTNGEEGGPHARENHKREKAIAGEEREIYSRGFHKRGRQMKGEKEERILEEKKEESQVTR